MVSNAKTKTRDVLIPVVLVLLSVSLPFLLHYEYNMMNTQYGIWGLIYRATVIAAYLIVGVLFGLTDYAYWLYITDLGVDRAYERQGIGKQLMKTAHDLAGGEKNIAVYLIANENAVPFYEKLGMEKADDVMQYNHIEWTDFTVR